MQSELLSISKKFIENLFRIPDYQRGYSWKEKHLKDFWNDLDQLEEGKHHYTGVLTLESVPSSVYQRWDDDLWIIEAKRYLPYYIVDGQQRLTTIIILLQTILEKISEDQSLNYSSKDEIRRKFIFESRDGEISRSYLFGYEKDNPSYQSLKTDIFLEKSDTHSASEQTIYTHNLAYAKSFFSERIANFDILSLEKLYSQVTQHFLFNIYTISDDIDVFVAFETMNNRGKPLSHLELLKNRLIYLSTKFQVDQTEKNNLRNVINECWKAAYHYFGKNKKRPLSDDKFLETHFFVHFGSQLPIQGEDAKQTFWKYQHDDYYKDYLLDEVFISRRVIENQGLTSNNLSVDSLYEYAHNIKSCVKIYYSLFNPSDTEYTDQEKIYLERLRRIGLNTHISVLLLALYQKETNPIVRVNILSLVEKIQFFQTISRYIRDVQDIDHLCLGVDMSSERSKSIDIINILKEHLDKALHKVKFNEVFTSWVKGYGYYGWKGIKYFMFEYEQELQAKFRTNREKLSWYEFVKESFETDYSTVEHIYPQKVADDCWKTAFNDYSVKERNILKNSIGNLVPLSKPKNSSLRNNCFSVKKGSKTRKVGYIYGCYSEIEVAQVADWTPKEILIRGVRLLEFMERRWGFHIGDTQVKIKALGLNFLKQHDSHLTID